MADYILRTRDLTKVFKNKTVVNKVSINVEKKDIYGLIGKNGAGKSTFMKMVCGMLIPTSGEIELFETTHLQNARKKIGCVIETPAIYTAMTAQENMLYYSKLIGEKEEKNDELLDFVGLKGIDGKKTGLFSLGMKQRLSIAIALIGDADFLILDEPINGLDPEGIKEMRDLLQKLNKQKGVTIFISSHILGELSKLATRYGIIEDGHLKEEFSSNDLERRCRKYIQVITDDVDDAVNILSNKLHCKEYSIAGNDEIDIYDENDRIFEINKTLCINDIKIKAISCKGQNLEEYFLENLGGKNSD